MPLSRRSCPSSRSAGRSWSTAPLPEERDVPGYKFAKQSCGFAVYKDPNDIPEFVYKTLGFEKPAHVEKPAKW